MPALAPESGSVNGARQLLIAAGLPQCRRPQPSGTQVLTTTVQCGRKWVDEAGALVIFALLAIGTPESKTQAVLTPPQQWVSEPFSPIHPVSRAGSEL